MCSATPGGFANDKKACDSGSARACYDLGVDYLNGFGVGMSPAAAAPLFKRACDGGLIKGCYNLGVLYAFGRGVEIDAVTAAALFRKACRCLETHPDATT